MGSKYNLKFKEEQKSSRLIFFLPNLLKIMKGKRGQLRLNIHEYNRQIAVKELPLISTTRLGLKEGK